MTWEQFEREYKRRLKTRWGIVISKPLCKKSYEPILEDLNDILNASKRMNFLHQIMVEEYGRQTQITTNDGVVLRLRNL